jgi:chemotaxis regulatin CheY-phosphate phosphatase CheZ
MISLHVKPIINVREIQQENLTGLMKRWNAANISVDDTMERFNMSRSSVEKIKTLTSEEIQRASEVNYSLFKFVVNEDFFDLAQKANNGKELSRLMDLQS